MVRKKWCRRVPSRNPSSNNGERAFCTLRQTAVPRSATRPGGGKYFQGARHHREATWVPRPLKIFPAQTYSPA